MYRILEKQENKTSTFFIQKLKKNNKWKYCYTNLNIGMFFTGMFFNPFTMTFTAMYFSVSHNRHFFIPLIVISSIFFSTVCLFVDFHIISFKTYSEAEEFITKENTIIEPPHYIVHELPDRLTRQEKINRIFNEQI